jgi:hypothetical protein
MTLQILNIILVFAQVSQSDNHVRQEIGTRKIVRRMPNSSLFSSYHLTSVFRTAPSM